MLNRWVGDNFVAFCRGGGAAHVILVVFVFWFTLRGPILSVRAERIGRKARQREGL